MLQDPNIPSSHLVATLNHIQDAVFSTSNSGTILWCNHAFSELLRLDLDKISNRKVDELLPIYKDRQALVDEKYPLRKVFDGKNLLQEHFEINSEEVWLHFEVSGYCFSEEKNATSAVYIMRNLTRRFSMEEQLFQSRKLEAIGSLAAGIAHEINTPAQYIRDNIDFLQDEMKKLLNYIRATHDYIFEDSTNKETGIQDITKQADSIDLDFIKDEIPQAIVQSIEGITRISEIVRSVKAFSHPGTKEFTEFNLNEAIQMATQVSKNEWKYVAELEFVPAQNLKSLNGHPSEINQVILNLIVNAAHAIGKKAKDAGTDDLGKITIKTRQLPRAIELTISDTGSGIPPEIQSKVFDPFFTTKPIGEGTGQGLSLAWRVVVEQHGGTLLFTSKPNEGTTFIIILPVKQLNKATETVVSALQTKN